MDVRGDEELARAYIAGDAAAMEALFLRYRKPVFGWLFRTLGNREDSDELYQEAWLHVLRHIGDFSSGSFKAWLWRIVKNIATDYIRKKRPMLALDVSAEEGDESAGTRCERISGDALPDALERMEEGERRKILCAAVDGLSPALKQVVLLRINGELEFREIADLLGLPLGTVLGRMHLAVKRMKDFVEEKGLV